MDMLGEGQFRDQQASEPGMTNKIVIVGAGQAAAQAIASLRAEGYSGAITLVGDELYPPYQRPPLSKAYLLGKLERDRLFLKPDQFYTEAGVELRLGVQATAIDRPARRLQLSDSSCFPCLTALNAYAIFSTAQAGGMPH